MMVEIRKTEVFGKWTQAQDIKTALRLARDL